MHPAKPKHQEIFDTLQQQIADGKYPSDRRLPSEMELAHRFKVSRPTAARALRDLVTQGIVTRRAGSGTFLRPIAPTASRRTLGLLVPGLGNTEIMDPICTEISRFAERAQMTVLQGNTSSSNTSADDCLAICDSYIHRKVDGVFFAPLESVPRREEINCRIAQSLKNAGIAVVLLDRDILDFPRRSDLDLVAIDNFHAGFILAQHLLSLGHKTFRFIARPQFPSTTDLRAAGVREAITQSAIPQTALTINIGEPDDPKFVHDLLTPAPDAFICSNDRTAALLIQTLSGLKVRVPDDVAIAGFDDVHYATLLAVPLTTIRQPCPSIGHAAVSAMQQRLDNPTLPPRQILLPVELIIRQSCGSARQIPK